MLRAYCFVRRRSLGIRPCTFLVCPLGVSQPTQRISSINPFNGSATVAGLFLAGLVGMAERTCTAVGRGLSEERAKEFPQELMVVFVLLFFLGVIGVRDLMRQRRESEQFRRRILS